MTKFDVLWTKQHTADESLDPSKLKPYVVNYICAVCKRWQNSLSHCPGYDFTGQSLLEENLNFFEGNFFVKSSWPRRFE